MPLLSRVSHRHHIAGCAHQRDQGDATMPNNDLLQRLRAWLRTMRCLACGERYARRLPYCPVCKHDPDNFGGVTPPPNPLK